MPVQYTPQFIPTNAQALQGVLSEYQQAYDQNLARELEVQDQYSMIPTIGAEDTTIKNELLGKFSSTLGELEKKYNYDRASSAYSKELAKRISNLRGEDFWTYNERKKELMKAEQEDKRRIGANYFSAVSPSEVTYNTRQNLDKYIPLNLEDLGKQVTAVGKEKATGIQTPIRKNIVDPRDGASIIGMEMGTQYGFSTQEEAKRFLDTNPQWLDEAVKGTAFEGYMDNPTVRGAAMNAALSSLVGETKTDYIPLPKLDTSTSTDGGGGGGAPLVKVSTDDPVVPELIAKGSKGVVELKNEMSDIDFKIRTAKTPEEKASYESAKYELQYKLDEVDTIVNNYVNDPVNKDIVDRGKALVSEFNSSLSDEQLTAIDGILRDYYISTSSLQRGLAADNDEKRIATEEIFRIAPLGKGRDLAKLFNKYSEVYKGNEGYAKRIESEVNKKLNDPERLVNDVYAPSVSTKSDDYTRQVNSIVRALPYLVPIEEDNLKGGKDGLLWKDSKLAEAQAMFAQPGTAITYLFDNNEGVLVRLSNARQLPSGKSQSKTVTLKVDPARSSMDMLADLYKYTGDARFLNAVHSNVKVPSNKEMKLGEDNYLTKALKEHPYFQGDISSLKNISVKKTTKDGVENYDLYLNGSLVETEPINNKAQLVETLANYQNPIRSEVKQTAINMGKAKSKGALSLTYIDNFDDFKSAISLQESANDYSAVNPHSGALGKYQFMPATLDSLGYNSNEFLNNPDIQEAAMNDLIASNVKYFRGNGFNIDPNNLTKEAIVLLTAAHYGGPKAAMAIANGSSSANERQYEIDPETGKKVQYPSVAEYIEQSMGVKLSDLNFDSLK